MRRPKLAAVLVVVLACWGSVLHARSDVAQDARPQLSGTVPAHVELLEDALLRKHPKLLGGSHQAAREMILRRYTTAPGPLRGYMAEAIFVERNPQWGYVRAPNAPQNDVYRWLPGRAAPFNGQIKYHDAGQPAVYARDMIRDYRAQRFFIPDDHVEPTKALLMRAAQRADTRGDSTGAQRFRRDYARLRPIGATAFEIRQAARAAAQYSATERYRGYTSLGAVLGSTLLHGLARGDVSGRGLIDELVRTTTVTSVEREASRRLARSKPSGLTRGFGKNIVLGSVFTVANTALIVNEQGFSGALSNPDVYVEAGGSFAGWSGSALAGWGTGVLFLGIGPAFPVLVLAGGMAGAMLSSAGYDSGIEFVRTWRHLAKDSADEYAAMAAFESRCQLKIKNVAVVPSVSEDAQGVCGG